MHTSLRVKLWGVEGEINKPTPDGKRNWKKYHRQTTGGDKEVEKNSRKKKNQRFFHLFSWEGGTSSEWERWGEA